VTRDVNRAATAFRAVRFWKILPRTSRATSLLKVFSRASAAYRVDFHLMMIIAKRRDFSEVTVLDKNSCFFVYPTAFTCVFAMPLGEDS